MAFYVHTRLLSISLTSNEVEAVIKKKNLPIERNPGPDGFVVEFSQMSKDLTFILLNLNAFLSPSEPLSHPPTLLMS